MKCGAWLRGNPDGRSTWLGRNRAGRRYTRFSEARVLRAARWERGTGISSWWRFCSGPSPKSGAALPCWLDGPPRPDSRLTDGRLPGGFVQLLSCLVGPMPSSVLPVPFSTGFASCLVRDGKAVAANTQAKLLGQFISLSGVAPVVLLPFRPLVPCPVVLQAALVLFLGCFRGYIVSCPLLGLLLS